MNDLIERYVHQVGRYLAPKERVEIEAELRSQIQDQLDDRYGESPSQEEVADVLAEFGHPYMMAASYNRDRYLVGPDLYPYLMLVLRYVWVLVPTIVIFMSIFGALVSSQPDSLPAVIIQTVVGAVEATLILSAIVVLIFAFIQRIIAEMDEKAAVFDPSTLPQVDDPSAVDRPEAIFGIVFGSIVALLFLYFSQVGGLTLRFNLSDPGEVIPVPSLWLVLLISAIFAMIILHLIMLRRNRWTVGLWLLETVLEVFGGICLYFVVYQPVFAAIVAGNPSLMHRPIIASAPELIAVGFACITLLSRGSRLVRLWSYQSSSAPSFATKPQN